MKWWDVLDLFESNLVRGWGMKWWESRWIKMAHGLMTIELEYRIYYTTRPPLCKLVIFQIKSQNEIKDSSLLPMFFPLFFFSFSPLNLAYHSCLLGYSSNDTCCEASLITPATSHLFSSDSCSPLDSSWALVHVALYLFLSIFSFFQANLQVD